MLKNQPQKLYNIQQIEHNKEYLVDFAIVAAMQEELSFVLSKFENSEFTEIEIHDFHFKIYLYNGFRVVITPIGVGATFASSMITFLYNLMRPNYIFMIGTAGGINENLNVGDVIIAEGAFDVEMQDLFHHVISTPFQSCLDHPLKKLKLPTQYSADANLLSICQSINIKNISIHRGTVASSNSFPAPQGLLKTIKQLNPQCIDMETSSLYQLAWLLNIKVISIRGISNILNKQGTDDNLYISDIDIVSKTTATVLFTILNKCFNNKKNTLTKKLEHTKPNDELHTEASQLIKRYNLKPHPEGGYFSQIYKSDTIVKPIINIKKEHGELRHAGTSIYYLLNKKDFSAWHRLKSDEIWHFYKGSPVMIYQIDPQGKLAKYILGDPLNCEQADLQVIIPAGVYFAAANIDKSYYSLVGCTVHPGFEEKDFELADETILNKFPNHKNIIKKLLR